MAIFHWCFKKVLQHNRIWLLKQIGSKFIMADLILTWKLFSIVTSEAKREQKGVHTFSAPVVDLSNTFLSMHFTHLPQWLIAPALRDELHKISWALPWAPRLHCWFTYKNPKHYLTLMYNICELMHHEASVWWDKILLIGYLTQKIFLN